MSSVHLHLLLSHVPVIGIIFVAFVLAAALYKHNSAMGKLALVTLAGIGAVTAFVFFTGEPAEEAVENLLGVSERAIHAHEEVAEASFIATSIAAVLALGALWAYRRRELSRGITTASLVVALAISGMMAWTANLGGQIRHTEIRAGVDPAATERDSDER